MLYHSSYFYKIVYRIQKTTNVNVRKCFSKEESVIQDIVEHCDVVVEGLAD